MDGDKVLGMAYLAEIHSSQIAPIPSHLPQFQFPSVPCACSVTPISAQSNEPWVGTFSIPALSNWHSFGIIPAPGSFASSAFPAPPNKSSETAPKISCVPPKKQTLALGAASSRFRVPQLQGQKRRNKMYQNRVHLIGYLGKNPEHKSVKTTDRKYAVLSLATQRSWKGADEEWHSKTEWHRIVAWNGLGEYAAAKLRKGDHIYVEGTLVSSTYQKEFGKAKNKIAVPLRAWQVKADSIRKLNSTKKDQVPDTAPLGAQPEEVPF